MAAVPREHLGYTMIVARAAYWLLFLSTTLGAIPTWAPSVPRDGHTQDGELPQYPMAETTELQEIRSDSEGEAKFEWAVLSLPICGGCVWEWSRDLQWVEMPPLDDVVVWSHGLSRAPPVFLL